MKPYVCLPPSAVAIFGAALIMLLAGTIAPAQTTQSIFPLFPASVSTIPSNGDVNPYGVVIVPKTLPAGGGIQPGDILVSNFNNNQNLQGTGTTIIRVSKTSGVSTLYTSAQPKVGLTAALGVLSNGWVLIGNLPTADGTAATAQPGNLSVLDRFGNFLGTIGTVSTVNGPWGMAVDDTGTGGKGLAHVFVTNVLSGTISRFDLTYTTGSLSATVLTLAEGFSHRTDPAALVLGPSGMAYEASSNTLLVASSTDNAVYQIPNAATASGTQSATLLFHDSVHLHGPLDIAILPDGHLVIANSDGSNADPNQPSELTEFTAQGVFVGQMPVDPNNGGAFGVAINNIGWGTFQMAYVDDNANSLTITTAVVP
jgi:hypothetical protein